MDRAQHLGHGHAVKTLPVSTFFCVHSATLDQKNLVHIYPRTYLQLHISSYVVVLLSISSVLKYMVYGQLGRKISTIIFFRDKKKLDSLVFGSKHF